jgi:hypothetical protein
MGTVLASLQRFFARLWFVLKLAFGPAKGAARSVAYGRRNPYLGCRIRRRLYNEKKE